MDEQASWKGQSFTLLVFGGIVFLCSIFFVLGMLVGRGQGERVAKAAALKEATKAAAAETKASEIDDLSADARSPVSNYQGITTGKEINPAPASSKTPEVEVHKSAEPAPVKTDKPAPKAAATVPPVAPKAVPAKPASPTPVKMFYLQVGAWEKDAAARKQVDELRKAGFPAVMVGGDGHDALIKVQAGPFATAADADASKRKLESMGYKPIRK